MFNRTEWTKPSAAMDNLGPQKTAAILGCDVSVIQKLHSPLEGYFLRWLTEEKTIKKEDKLFSIMKDFGETIINDLKGLDERIKTFKSGGAELIEIGGIKGLFINIEKEPSRGVNIYIKEEYGENTIGFSISKDDRGPGWCLYRFNDHPKINFAHLKGEKGKIIFAHPGGFIAKTHPMRKKAITELVRKAIKES